MAIRSSILLGILLVLATFIGTYIMPFEWLVFLLFVIGALSDIKQWKVFIMGLLFPAMVWVGVTLIKETGYERSVASLVGDILEGIPSWLVFVLVGLTIGLVSGFSVLSGNLLRSIIVKNYNQKNHNG